MAERKQVMTPETREKCRDAVRDLDIVKGLVADGWARLQRLDGEHYRVELTVREVEILQLMEKMA